MTVLFLLILPVIKCYMNLLKPFNSFISSLRALYLCDFALIYCSWDDVTGCLVHYLPCLYSQTECLYIPHIHIFIQVQAFLFQFVLCCTFLSYTIVCLHFTIYISFSYCNLLLSPAKFSFSSRPSWTFSLFSQGSSSGHLDGFWSVSWGASMTSLCLGYPKMCTVFSAWSDKCW